MHMPTCPHAHMPATRNPGSIIFFECSQQYAHTMFIILLGWVISAFIYMYIKRLRLEFNWMSRPYIAMAIDQHENGYCGACYLVAPVQMLQDRLAIRGEVHTGFDLQTMLNEYTYIKQQSMRLSDDILPHNAWHGCVGGCPLDVLDMIQDGRLRVPWTDKPTQPPSHRPVGAAPEQHSKIPAIEQRWLEGETSLLRAHIRHHGPVIMFMSASSICKCEDESENHIISVVGSCKDGWICRNSWGSKNTTRMRPHTGLSGGVLLNSEMVEWQHASNGCFIKSFEESMKVLEIIIH